MSEQNGTVDAIGGGLMTALERIASQGAQLLGFVVAARVLGPADFGVFALVSACAILLMRAAEGGWAAYIMAWSGDPRIPRQVLWIALLSGLSAGLVGGGSGVVLHAMDMPDQVVALVLLFSVWLVLAVYSSAQKGVLVWQRRLKTAALLEIVSEVVGLATALALLWSGAGVLALVMGRIGYQAVHLAGGLALTRAFPQRGLNGAPLRALLSMSGQLFAVRMIYNLRLYAATFMIGVLLGPAAVGVYRAAERLVGAMGEVVSVPSMTLSWGLFRQARDRSAGTSDGFQAQANAFFPALIALTAPLFLWVAIMAEEIVTGLLGAEWLPALPVVALLAVSRALVMPGAVTEPILTLAGQIRQLPRITMFYLVLTLASVLVAAPFGLVPLAVGQVVVAVAILAVNTWTLRRYAGIDWRGFAPVLMRTALPMVAGGLALWGLRDSTLMQALPPLTRAFAVVPPAVLVYGIALLVAVPDWRDHIGAAMRRWVASKRAPAP